MNKLKNKISKLFSSQFNLTSIILITVFLFKLLPDVIKYLVVCVITITMLLTSYSYKKKGKPLVQVVFLLQCAIAMPFAGGYFIFKNKSNELYKSLFSVASLLTFLSILITMIIVTFGTRNRKNLILGIGCVILMVIPIIFVIFYQLNVLISKI